MADRNSKKLPSQGVKSTSIDDFVYERACMGSVKPRCTLSVTNSLRIAPNWIEPPTITLESVHTINLVGIDVLEAVLSDTDIAASSCAKDL